ncbi:hypothetical protein [Falsiroseomonas stagni]|uniref:Uncharacterized protein n=1 Tax=Falsiroseomonas stagni DSM 19981 TaxID=1123062 RepID=A0A1I3Z6C2_9PROT|nr:hypothetical protein [Falsiroseomonas stagni]SFK39605.1 hypothetical protein SAMN02745775_102220 [Falsiroseomonas stagni DSM 19981]
MGQAFLQRIIGSGVRRLAAGILLAALAAMAVGMPAVMLLAVLRGEATLPADAAAWREALDLWLDMLPLLPFAMLFTLIGGLPMHLALAAMRRQGFLGYAVAGALGGGLLLGTLLGATTGGLGLRPAIQGAAIGVVAGLVFRAVWRPVRSG